MNKLVFLLVFLISNLVLSNDAVQIKFRTSQDDFQNKLYKTWNSKSISFNSKLIVFGEIKKSYIVVSVESEDDLNGQVFKDLVYTTSKLIFDHVLNIREFKGALLDFTNLKTEVKKSKVIYEVLDKEPVYKGCNPKATNKKLRACFNEKLRKLVLKKIDPTEFNNIGLEKRKHTITIDFVIDRNGEIKDVVVNHTNEIIKESLLRFANSIEIKRGGFNNGNFVETNYRIPISFRIE